MKRRSFRSPNPGAPAASVFVGAAFAVILILLSLLRFLWPDAFFALARPFWSAGTAASDTLHGAFPAQDAATLSRELADERVKSAALSREVDRLESEAAGLHALIGDARPSLPGLVAAVLARPPFSAYDTLVIGIGSQGGVSVGAIVTAAGGIPIGSVASVAAGSAQVSLYSLPGRATLAWAGAARTPITVIGSGSGSFDASAPKDTTVAVGDAVVSSGSVPFARIVRIDENPSSPTKMLRIQLLVNANALPEVLVLR